MLSQGMFLSAVWVQAHTLMLVFLLALCGCGSERLPNIVFVMADDVGYECFSPYGSKQYDTPRIEELAANGVLFTNSHATPLCTPSRVTLMTGKSNVRNYTDFGTFSPGQFTMVDMLRDAGYATAIAGKWQLQGTDNAAGLPAGHGFDTYCLWNTGNTARARYWNPSLESDGRILELGADEYGPDIFTDFLLQFMEENREQPFFVYYPMVLPHTPFLPTPHSENRESEVKQANFEDMVNYVDFLTGRFIDKLEQLELTGETVFIFTADNGSHHDLVSELQGRSIRGDKGATTDAGTHVPLIVSAPGLIQGNRVIDDLIDFSDFLPTIADLSGQVLPPGELRDGISFRDSLLGQAYEARDAIFTYYFPRPFAGAYDDPYRHPEVRYARDKQYKLYGNGMLFDVNADPLEETPLPEEDGQTVTVRNKLQTVLDAMPQQGEMIPAERSAASRAAPRPRW